MTQSGKKLLKLRSPISTEISSQMNLLINKRGGGKEEIVQWGVGLTMDDFVLMFFNFIFYF